MIQTGSFFDPVFFVDISAVLLHNYTVMDIRLINRSMMGMCMRREAALI